MRSIVLISLILFTIHVTAQTDQQANTHHIIIDAYLGGPNLYSRILKTMYTPSDITPKSKASIPYGGRIEYKFNKKYGVGIDVQYATNSLNWQKTDTNDITHPFRVEGSRLRISTRYFYHFISNDKIDVYITIGLGYKDNRIKLYQDNPEYKSFYFPIGAFPISWRAGAGFRYFFSKNVGLNVEAGIGGAFITGGLSCRF